MARNLVLHGHNHKQSVHYCPDRLARFRGGSRSASAGLAGIIRRGYNLFSISREATG